MRSVNRFLGVFFCFLFLTASLSTAYDVVLKNGKTLTGKVVSESQELIILRDSSGVQLRIKKRNIDWIRTEELNKKSEAIQIEPSEEKTSKSDVKTAAKAKTKARVYKKEDLEKMPELTVLGSDESPDDDILQREYEEDSQREKEAEAAWNEAALQIDDRIREAQDAYDYNKNFCDKVIPDVDDLSEGGYVKLTAEQYEEQRRIACMEAEASAKDLESAKAAYEELLEDARKKGIPPGWVDPDRIRN